MSTKARPGIRLDENLYADLKEAAREERRSLKQQLEVWARLGQKISEKRKANNQYDELL